MKRKGLGILVAILTMVFVLTSCGGGTSTKAPEKVDQMTAELVKGTNPEKLPDVAKNRKDTLIVGGETPDGKFNPIYSGDVYTSWATGLVFEGLLTNDRQGNPVPLVAEKWEVSEDQKTYTFHIRKGIKFSNGEELTADDVAFTYTAMADPNYDGPRADAVQNLVGYEEYNKGDAASVSGIKVVDKYTISFTEKEVKAPALLGDFIFQIMPKSIYGFEKGGIQKLKDLFEKPVGAGPYLFKSWKAGQEVVFEANPNYWQGAPKIKNIIMKKTTAQTNIQELSSGGIDIDTAAAKPENIDMIKAAGFLDIQLFPDNGYGYMGWNTRLDMFSDKKVRQALMYGLNRQGFVDAYYKGYATVCNVPISPVSWGYTEDVNQYQYDPEKANKLLDEAGWVKKDDGFRYKNDKKFVIHWMTYTGSKYVETLIPIVKENWKALGIEVIPELMEFSTLTSKVFDNQEFEMFNMAWSLSIDPDPSGIFGKAQDVKGGFNSVGWSTEESERIMAEALKTTDQAKRKELYNQWMKLANEELPYLFLSQNKQMYVLSSRVKNIDFGPYRDWTYDIHKAELAQ